TFAAAAIDDVKRAGMSAPETQRHAARSEQGRVDRPRTGLVPTSIEIDLIGRAGVPGTHRVRARVDKFEARCWTISARHEPSRAGKARGVLRTRHAADKAEIGHAS